MGDDYEHINHSNYAPESYTWNNVSDLAERYTDSAAVNSALGSYSGAYQKAKGFLPYLGSTGQAVHAGLVGAELAYSAYVTFAE